MPTASPDDLMTAAELAARVGVRPGTILQWHRKGRIPARKLSPKVLRFNLSEVLSALHDVPDQGHESGKAVAE